MFRPESGPVPAAVLGAVATAVMAFLLVVVVLQPALTPLASPRRVRPA